MGFGVILGALAHLATYAIASFFFLAFLGMISVTSWEALKNQYPKESDNFLISIGHKFWKLWLWFLVVVPFIGALILVWVAFWEFLYCFDSDNDCQLLGGVGSAFGPPPPYFYQLIPRWLE